MNSPSIHPVLPRRRARVLAMLLAALPVLPAAAAPFLYAPGDLVAVFRQPGSASDLVVNLGRVTEFNAVAPDRVVELPRVAPTQLASAFPSLAGLRWSVAAANRPPILAEFPLQTLWVTAPRAASSPASPATPWLRKGSFVQGNAGAQIDAIGVNTALVSSLLPGGPDNTATAVLLPTSASYPLAPVLGDGNYAGTFQGQAETVVPDDFADAPTHRSRADLYELAPGTSAAGTLNSPGRHLGYFELAPDGAFSFRTTAPAPAPPRIRSITRSPEITRIVVETVAGTQYRLRSTDAAGLASPLSRWTTSAPLPSSGATLEIEDTRTDAVRFYTVEAVR